MKANVICFSGYRAYHTSQLSHLPYKDSQDRTSLKPQAAGQTLSGRDSDVAAIPAAAFGQNDAQPESAMDTAGKEANQNPLELSGAYPQLSNPPETRGSKESDTRRHMYASGQARCKPASGPGKSERRGMKSQK